MKYVIYIHEIKKLVIFLLNLQIFQFNIICEMANVLKVQKQRKGCIVVVTIYCDNLHFKVLVNSAIQKKITLEFYAQQK